MITTLQSVRKHKLAYALLFVVLYQVLCAVQGFDLSDEGWGMYFYQQIFKNPEYVTAQMPYWVTGVIGGAWNMLFPMGGFLGMRLLGIIMVTGTFYLSYVFLKKSINSGWLLIGLIAQVLIVAGDPKPYGYNSLTTFFVLLAVIALWNGLERRKLIWLFIGGLLLGINIFVRIPNVAILPILLLIPCYLYWKNKKILLFNRELWIAIAGVGVGFSIIILAMHHWGYWDLFMESLTGVANSAKDSSNSHQIGRLIASYSFNYWGIIRTGSAVVLLGAIYVYLRSKITKKLFIWVTNILVAFILILAEIHFHATLRDYDMFFAQFISYTGTILLLVYYNRNKNFRLRYAALASLLMIICIPLGSDRGITTMWTSAWLALPLGTAYIYSLLEDKLLFDDKLNKFSPFKKAARNYFGILFLVYIGCNIHNNDNLAYYDPSSRLEKIHSINNPYCRFIYTNSYRAGLMNELLPELEKYVKPDDYLLVYNFMPGLNYMTNTRSYVSNAWVWSYSGPELKQQLETLMSQNKPLPVVVRQHFVATNRWLEYDPHYADADRTPENVLSRSEQTKIFNDFLEHNHYKTVWTNLNFEILLPEVQFKRSNKYETSFMCH